MKVEIHGNVRGTPEVRKIWEGELSALPRPDDYIVLDEDKAALSVRNVMIIAPTNKAIINVWAPENEYPAID
ncbi:hypothetical protein [Hyphomicrobium sp. 99]|uniref:hypothetical protein n=1 Tax=Hyphomicrobium sp. 99 TaxID=1163419 RepID=UPI0005F8170D|nr:hypothetical protein [Hyphomicrobium sp. 99]